MPESVGRDPRLEQLRHLGASIAEDVYFGPDVYVEDWFAPLLTIESGVIVSQGVTVLLHDSSLNNVTGDDVMIGEVILRRNCYLGANATLLCGLQVGAGALVGACSLVREDVPSGSVAYGSPARVAGTIDQLRRTYRERPRSVARTSFVPATPWRDRTAADHADLHRRIDDEIRRLAES